MTTTIDSDKIDDVRERLRQKFGLLIDGIRVREGNLTNAGTIPHLMELRFYKEFIPPSESLEWEYKTYIELQMLELIGQLERLTLSPLRTISYSNNPIFEPTGIDVIISVDIEPNLIVTSPSTLAKIAEFFRYDQDRVR